MLSLGRRVHRVRPGSLGSSWVGTWPNEMLTMSPSLPLSEFTRLNQDGRVFSWVTHCICLVLECTKCSSRRV